MREIRFRGFIKYPSDIINGFWYGDLIHYANGDIYIRQVETGMENEVIPESVGQFTGVVDKNGVGIYEGDILLDVEFDENGNNISSKFPVVYDYSKCQFAIDNSFKKDGSSLVNFVEYFGIENLEVVGNICDNPEMLFSF